jgi:hypothetical protein
MKRQVIFHPLLFAAAPVLYLCVTNLEQLPLREGLFLSVAIMLITAAIWAGSRLIFQRRWDKAACFTSLLVFTFLGYTRIFDTSGQLDSLVKLGAWLSGLAIAAAVIRRSRRDFRQLTAFLNVVALAWVTVIATTGLYAALVYARDTMSRANAYSAAWDEALPEFQVPLASSGPGPLPDIYYIILDGYGRADVLKDMYDYDSSAFIEFLKQSGFYVADRSISNYGQTALSNASALNFCYLDDLAQQMTPESSNRLPLDTMIKSNHVIQFLRQNGYQIATFPAGYSFTDISTNVDRQVSPPVSLSALQQEVLRLTPLPDLSRVLTGRSLLDVQRERILYTLEHLPDVTTDAAPTFVFAHILAPHPPFVFGAKGEPTGSDQLAVTLDGSWFTARYGREAYLQGYQAQATFITNRLRATIERILASARRPTIIVIQGDHGPGSLLDWENPPNSDFRERMSILNAYYFPDGKYDRLYPGISPVNTFRVIFNDYFGANLSLLEDRAFFSGMARPYDLLDVTDQIATP